MAGVNTYLKCWLPAVNSQKLSYQKVHLKLENIQPVVDFQPD